MEKFYFKDTWFYKHILSAIFHPITFLFCLKYPFWKSRNVFTGTFSGYDSTWYDAIPKGWRRAFGKQLSKDIVKAFKADKIKRKKWSEKLYWEQIKEKFGELRLYASTTEKVQYVLNKYEHLSIGYCINCGKPARYHTCGWIEYYCEDCYNKLGKEEKNDADRLTEFDIPHLIRYHNSEEIEIDLKRDYDIDFEELWGLK